MLGADSWSLALDLRDLVRLLVLSAAFVLVSRLVFQRNAPSRRKFTLWAAGTLLVAPWLVAWLNLAIPVGLVEPPHLPLEQPVPGWLVGLVLLVSSLGLARVGYAAHRLQRRLRMLPQLTDPRLQALSSSLMAPLGLTTQPQFRAYRPGLGLPQAPFATSKAGGQVVLPQDYTALDDHKLRAVVTHELVHLARRDDWGRLSVRILVSLYWFLPWLRWLERDYLEAMEHSCDDRAADFFGPSLTYMEAVVGAAGLRVAATAKLAPSTVTHASPGATRHPLLRRVLRFGHRREFDGDSVRVAGYLALTACLGVGLVALQPIAKPRAQHAATMVAGLAVPLPASQLVPVPSHQVQVSLARPQGQTNITRSLRALDQPQPVYPGHALRAELEGEVWVDYGIALDGTVVRPTVVHSEPAGHFERSALATVRRTRYQHLSAYQASTLEFSRTGVAAGELRVRQRFRYQLTPSH